VCLQSQFNRALLTPKTEEADLLEKQQEDSLVARMKMFVHLRQDLERVRLTGIIINMQAASWQILQKMFFLKTVINQIFNKKMVTLKMFFSSCKLVIFI